LAVIASTTAQEPGSAQAGRQLFESYQCWQCHGYEGQGGAAPRIAPTVYPFEAFAQLVRHTNEMPAYSPNSLSDEQLRRIYEYVRSRPEPPPVEDIPALRDL
jgi:mono/diheme cytochrome c family protein